MILASMPPTDGEREKLARYFEAGFEELALRDIRHANENDVRMGTFILCVAFLDSLAIAYSAGMKGAGKLADKWRRFIRRYFDERYERVANSYGDFRSLLIHNYSAAGLAFTSRPENARDHLATLSGDVLILHRESFVADVERAYHAFRADVESDGELRARVLRHLEKNPPMGVALVQRPSALSISMTDAVVKLDK
jgi:hypothetical protein